ncbi:hypothetical protein T36_2250 (plasmid) [Helicobacter cinaedi]|nr:hypothetical protein T36_2250 [Helicobacter cinaedi]
MYITRNIQGLGMSHTSFLELIRKDWLSLKHKKHIKIL